MPRPTERPISLHGHEVRAILNGTKTTLRRVIKGSLRSTCPFGGPGTRLWARETWRPAMEAWSSYVEYEAGGRPLSVDRDRFDGLTAIALRFPGARKDIKSEAWHPSIHMPRWASRITLVNELVLVERVKDITEEGARAEGVPGYYHGGYKFDWRKMPPSVANFRRLLEETSGAAAWDSNEWVRALTFYVGEVRLG